MKFFAIPVAVWVACCLSFGVAFAGDGGPAADASAPVPVVRGANGDAVPESLAAGDAVPVEEKEPLGQRIAEKLMARGWPVEGAIVAISLLPIVELRGAIPVGHVLIGDEDPSTHLGAEDWRRAGKVFLWAVLGNMLPIPFILMLLGPLTRLAMKFRAGKRFFDWLFARTRRKTADIEKYGFWGLALFVAVPLPVTGAWTGAMAGWLLGIRPVEAFVSILIGVLVAGCIMTALSLMKWVGLIVAVVALGLLAASMLIRIFRKPASPVP